MDIKLYFQKLTIFQKIEVYLLVIMLYGAVLYFYDDITAQHLKKQPVNTIQDQKTIKHHNDIKKLRSKIIKKDNGLLIRLLEEKSEEFKVSIQSTKLEKNYIVLQIVGKFLNIINFLNYCENHFIIEDFKMIQDKKDIICNIKIDTKHFYDPNKIYNHLSLVANPFINTVKDINKSNPKNNTLTVTAIVSKYVCINKQWYKKNETVRNHKIIAIDTNRVELLNLASNKKQILRIYDE